MKYPTGTLTSFMADYLSRVPIVVCLACGWWQQYRRVNPTDPRAVSDRPRWCPECDTHHGIRRGVVDAVAAITVTEEADRG